MAQVRLQCYVSKRPRACSRATRVTPARPTKRVPLQDIMEETQSAHDDDLASREERSVIDSSYAFAVIMYSR